MLIFIALTAGAAEPPWATLSNDSDWKDIGSKRSDVGEIHIRTRKIDGIGCVEGTTEVATSAEKLVDVTRDMVRSIDWSTADVALSEELDKSAGSFVLFQYWDAPMWTFAADRFWVIRGEPQLDGNAGSYRYYRVAVEQFPDAAEQASDWSRNSIEVPINYGEWTFTPSGAETRVQYRGCADFGGRLPTAVQQWLNTQQLPAMVSDLVSEANRR